VEDGWEQLDGRKLIVDLTQRDGDWLGGGNMLFKLMREGAKFGCEDVFTNHVVRQRPHAFRFQVAKVVQAGKRACHLPLLPSPFALPTTIEYPRFLAFLQLATLSVWAWRLSLLLSWRSLREWLRELSTRVLLRH
jgi:hypothetical protein